MYAQINTTHGQHTHTQCETSSAVYEGESFVCLLLTDDNIHTAQMRKRKVNDPPPHTSILLHGLTTEH